MNIFFFSLSDMSVHVTWNFVTAIPPTKQNLMPFLHNPQFIVWNNCTENKNFIESRNCLETWNVRLTFQAVEFLPAKVGLNYPNIVNKFTRSTKWFIRVENTTDLLFRVTRAHVMKHFFPLFSAWNYFIYFSICSLFIFSLILFFYCLCITSIPGNKQLL